MALSYMGPYGPGSSFTTFTYTQACLSIQDIQVEAVGFTLTSSISRNESTKTLSFSPAISVPSGGQLYFRRVTPKTSMLNVFVALAAFRWATVDQNFTQCLYWAQEAYEQSGLFAAVPWAAITGKPTTLAGYGITDAVKQATGPSVVYARNSTPQETTINYSQTPSALSFPLRDASQQLAALTLAHGAPGATNNDLISRAFLTFANLLGKPTTLAGFGITDAVVRGSTASIVYGRSAANAEVQYPADTAAGAGAVAVRSSSGALRGFTPAAAAPEADAQDLIQRTYFTFTNLLGKPSTLAGYGITDGVQKSGVALRLYGTNSTTGADTVIPYTAYTASLLAAADAAGARTLLQAFGPPDRGAANGIAALDASALVPLAQLPADVKNVQQYATVGAFPATGATNVIYIAASTGAIYYWTGSAYAPLSSTPAAAAWGSIVGTLTDQTDLVTALNARQPLDADLTAIAALTSTGVVKRTGANTWSAGALVAGDIPDLSATYVPKGAATASGLTMATNKLLGRSTAGTGTVEEITIGPGLVLSGGTLTGTGGSGGQDADHTVLTYRTDGQIDTTVETMPDTTTRTTVFNYTSGVQTGYTVTDSAGTRTYTYTYTNGVITDISI